MGNMKSKVRLGAFAGAFGVALMASSGASAITIAGINLAPGSNLQTTTIWENTVAVPGDTLTGIGRVDVINAPSCPLTICWTNGTNGKQLTFQFSYTLAGISPTIPAGGPVNVGTAYFTGGTVNFYTAPAGTFTAYTGPPFPSVAGQPADFASALGAPFLNLVGGNTGIACVATCIGGVATPVTLFSIFFYGSLGFADILSLPSTGIGFLDVTGGSGVANFNFNTNTFVGHDLDLSSGFSKDTTASDFPLSGSASLKSNVKIPEPGSLLLLGTGLLGLARLRRKRKSA